MSDFNPMEVETELHPLPYFVVLLALQKHTMDGNFDHSKYTDINGDKVTVWRLEPFNDGHHYVISSHNNTKEGEQYNGSYKMEVFHQVIAYHNPKDGLPVWRVNRVEKDAFTLRREAAIKERDEEIRRSNEEYFKKKDEEGNES